MGKLVRVLVVICLLLSIGALVLGHMLFAKREVLKGRTQKLEKTFTQVASLIEAEAPTLDSPPQYPARDVSPNTLDYLNDPEMSTFWDGYSNDLELIDAPTINLNKRKVDMMTFYKRTDGKIEKDTMGMKKTSGPGTLQAVLDDVLAGAESQYNRLNETRQLLAETRAELVDAIRDLNQTKQSYRGQIKLVQDLQAQVARLEAELREKTARVEELEEMNRALEDSLAEERLQVQRVEEQKVELEDTITQLKNELSKRRATIGMPTVDDSGDVPGDAPVLDAGMKGSVVAVNRDWNFAVLALNEDFLVELLGPDLSGTLTPVDLMVKRSIEGKDTFVTKVRVKQVRRDKNLAIADILSDWQVESIEEGDILFY